MPTDALIIFNRCFHPLRFFAGFISKQSGSINNNCSIINRNNRMEYVYVFIICVYSVYSTIRDVNVELNHFMDFRCQHLPTVCPFYTHTHTLQFKYLNNKNSSNNKKKAVTYSHLYYLGLTFQRSNRHTTLFFPPLSLLTRVAIHTKDINRLRHAFIYNTLQIAR